MCIKGETDMIRDKLPASKEALRQVNEQMEELTNIARELRERAIHMEERKKHIEERAIHIEEREKHIEERAIHIEEREKHIEERAIHIEEREKHIEEKLTSIQQILNKCEKNNGNINDVWNALYRYINIDNKNKNANYFMAAVPDSLNYFHKYPEYNEVYPLFVEKNTENNLKDFTRLYMFILNLNHIFEKNIPGSLAELGVYKGNNSAVMMNYCKKYDRKLFMFDTFEGFDERDLTGVDEKQKMQFTDTSLEEVKKYVGENEWSRYVKGFFPDSATEESKNETYAFVSLDCDLYAPIKAGMEFFYPRLSNGGMIFIHDYSSGFFEGCKKAVDEFCEKENVSVVLMPDKSGTAVVYKN